MLLKTFMMHLIINKSKKVGVRIILIPKFTLFSVTIIGKEISFFSKLWKRFLIEKYYHLILESIYIV
jgi:hypothetical protein